MAQGSAVPGFTVTDQALEAIRRELQEQERPVVPVLGILTGKAGEKSWLFGFHSKRFLDRFSPDSVHEIGGVKFWFDTPRAWENELAGRVLDFNGRMFVILPEIPADQVRKREAGEWLAKYIERTKGPWPPCERPFQITWRAAEWIKYWQQRLLEKNATVLTIAEVTYKGQELPQFGFGFGDNKELERAQSDCVHEVAGHMIIFNEPHMWERKLCGVTMDWDGEQFRFLNPGEAPETK